VAEAVVATLEPIQQRYKELCEPGVIEEILEKGAQKAEAVSTPVLRRLQDALGLLPRKRP